MLAGPFQTKEATPARPTSNLQGAPRSHSEIGAFGPGTSPGALFRPNYPFRAGACGIFREEAFQQALTSGARRVSHKADGSAWIGKSQLRDPVLQAFKDLLRIVLVTAYSPSPFLRDGPLSGPVDPFRGGDLGDDLLCDKAAGEERGKRGGKASEAAVFGVPPVRSLGCF